MLPRPLAHLSSAEVESLTDAEEPFRHEDEQCVDFGDECAFQGLKHELLDLRDAMETFRITEANDDGSCLLSLRQATDTRSESKSTVASSFAASEVPDTGRRWGTMHSRSFRCEKNDSTVNDIHKAQNFLAKSLELQSSTLNERMDDLAEGVVDSIDAKLDRLQGKISELEDKTCDIGARLVGRIAHLEDACASIKATMERACGRVAALERSPAIGDDLQAPQAVVIENMDRIISNFARLDKRTLDLDRKHAEVVVRIDSELEKVHEFLSEWQGKAEKKVHEFSSEWQGKAEDRLQEFLSEWQRKAEEAKACRPFHEAQTRAYFAAKQIDAALSGENMLTPEVRDSAFTEDLRQELDRQAAELWQVQRRLSACECHDMDFNGFAAVRKAAGKAAEAEVLCERVGRLEDAARALSTIVEKHNIQLEVAKVPQARNLELEPNFQKVGNSGWR